ncbi:MAG TPA: response regulator transcription factor [Chloroflexota bacterium]|jgi:two-component system KDP operon response regulator KdpE|nr:response regulator transcription factor [Chloroflexota bacterium]
MSEARVLVIDDEPQIRRSLRVALRANGYEVEEAMNGEMALEQAASRPPDLIILDLSLPGIDGVEVCKRLREWTQLPIIVLSAHGDEQAKVRALDEGADDYVTKPFSVPELLARMRVAVRRAAKTGEPPLQVMRSGDVTIDLTRRLVHRAGEEIHLTPTEYGVLRYLVEHAGRVVTHGQLLRTVMGPGYEDAVGSLRVYVASLRKKLEADPASPRMITTEPGVGYRFRPD